LGGRVEKVSMSGGDSGWTFVAKYLKSTEKITGVDPDKGWGVVKEKIQQAFGIDTDDQKVICRGRKVDDNLPVRKHKGAKDGAKLMVLSSKKKSDGVDGPPRKKKMMMDMNRDFKKGEKAIYKDGDTVTVLASHHDDEEEVYYTIRMPDGHERQTLKKYLKRPSESATGKGVPAKPSLPTAVPMQEDTEDKKGDKANDNDTKSAATASLTTPPEGVSYVIVNHGAKPYYVPCDAKTETLGGLKRKVGAMLGIPHDVVRLVSGRLSKANDDTVLATVKIKHKSKMLVLFKEGFHIGKYGEEMIRKVIKEMEEAEAIASSLEKRLEHRGVGLSESVQLVGSLRDRIDNLHRTIEGLTVKKTSEGTVDNMKLRLRELRKQIKRIDQKRTEFG